MKLKVCNAVCLFYFLLAMACQKPKIVGHWHLELFESTHGIDTNYNHTGDFSFFDDSSFLLVGPPSLDVDTIPGWHVGGDTRGTWTKNDTSLVLNIDAGPYKLTMPYRIIEFTQKKLVLRLNFAGDESTHNISYSRKE